MVVQRSLILERHNQLVNYNGYADSLIPRILNKESDNYVFECYLTVDERYFVLHDEVFDIQEKTTLGNIWDSIDNFKTIFRNVNIDNSDYKQIQEGWGSLPILEGVENLHAIRDFLIQEGLRDWISSVGSTVWNGIKDAGEWAYDKVSGAVESVKDFAVSTWEGIKALGIAISKGDWSEILKLIGMGALWVLRKLKSAAYSTVGIIVDAILIATGIGKGAQAVVWGLITALDVYQLVNNDYTEEEASNPMWYKILELGFDILGLVTTGVAAKGARALFKPLKGLTNTKLAQTIAKNPKMKSFITKIYDASKSGLSKMKSIQTTVASKWGAGGRFIAKIMGSIGNFIKKLQEWCGKIIKTMTGGAPRVKTGREFIRKGGRAGLAAAGVTYGMEKMLGVDDESPGDVDMSSVDVSSVDLGGAEIDPNEF